MVERVFMNRWTCNSCGFQAVSARIPPFWACYDPSERGEVRVAPSGKNTRHFCPNCMPRVTANCKKAGRKFLVGEPPKGKARP